MFYFLMIVGFISILMGLYIDEVREKPITEDLTYKNVEELYLLNNRIRQLEKVLLEETLDMDFLEKNTTISDKTSLKVSHKEEKENISGYGLEKYRLLLKYESENQSAEEIYSLLNMNKGEVLLLKNLYKNYQKLEEVF